MKSKTQHPNTSTLLAAWERMSESSDPKIGTAKASDHPDLLDCLFVMERAEEARWLFRNAGDRLGQLLGRELADHDFLDFWTGYDRQIVEGLLNTVRESHQPGLLHASGETLTGTRLNIELMIAPLPAPQANANKPRLIGLYQILAPQAVLKGRPLWRHRVTAAYPPELSPEPAHLRLVASND
ncbi:MAG: PAS domain-containing protein [Pseudomonadota bacterium]